MHQHCQLSAYVWESVEPQLTDLVKFGRSAARCATLEIPKSQTLNPQDAVEAVISILGMAPCDGTDAVPPNARSHTVLLSGHFVGGVPALARISFGIDLGKNVAMKLVTRSQSPDVSEALHQIIQS